MWVGGHMTRMALLVVAVAVLAHGGRGVRAFGVVDAVAKAGGFQDAVFGVNEGAYDPTAWVVADVDGVHGENDVVAPFKYNGRDGTVLGMQVFNGSDSYRLAEVQTNVDGWGRGLAHAACDFSGGTVRGDVVRVWQGDGHVFVSLYHTSLRGGAGVNWPHALSQTLFTTGYEEEAGVWCADVDGDGVDDVLVAVPHLRQSKMDVWWLLSTHQHLVQDAVRSAVPLAGGEGKARAWGEGMLVPAAHADALHVFAVVYSHPTGHTLHGLSFNATTHAADDGIAIPLPTLPSDGHVLVGDVCGEGALDVVAVSGQAVRYGAVYCGREALATPHTTTLGEYAAGTYLLSDVNGDGLRDVVAPWKRAGGHLDLLAWTSVGAGGALDNVTAFETAQLWRDSRVLLDAPGALVLPYTTNTPPAVSPTPTPSATPTPTPGPHHKHGVPPGIIAAVVGGGLMLVLATLFVVRYFRREPGLEGSHFVSIQ